MPDAFERFAEECGLHLTAEPLCVAPRDVLAPLGAMEQHFLVELSRPSSDTAPVRLIFITPVTEPTTPATRDVLWWLAGDAWALERGDRSLEHWAATYGYPPDESATARLFDQCVRQANALAEVLGELDCRRLLTLYEAEVSPSRA
jgi:hypothetical protein